MNKLLLNQFFILLTLISPFLGYFFSSGLIAYGPILILISTIIFFEIISPTKLEYKEFLYIFSFLPFCILALIYYFMNPLGGEILTTHFLNFISIPFFIFSILYINRYSKDGGYFLLRLIFVFLLFQTIICLGQIMTLTYGIGLPLSRGHSDGLMITGTFNNSNDLSNIALISLAIFLIGKNSITNRFDFFYLLLILFIVLVTGSRSTIVLSTILLLLNFRFKMHSLLIFSLLIGVVFLFFNFVISSIDSDGSGRIISRLESIVNIYNNGLDSDGSMSVRFQSYIHFLTNIPHLGVGSGNLKNYYMFSNGALFETWLIFENPHSLIIEVGYWLGFLGLLFIIFPFSWIAYSRKLKPIFLIIILVSSMIPSSVLGSFIYFLFIFILIFFNSNSSRTFK